MSPSTHDVRVRCCTTCGAVYRTEYPRCLSDGTELVMMNRDPLVGANVGPYIVDALLGEGGMGRVYRVHHARLQQKRYALKVLLGDYSATPPMRMRFAKEAQSASRLSHPNVVAVCDFGVTDAGLAYLAMDLVEGTPLSELITSQPMAPGRVIHLARQLCMGLAHAHDLGLIHRDFKPDNIIVVPEPAGEVPRIADFGLAITNDSHDVRLTTGGMVLGTPAYVAPEQVTGSEVDHRADLYALGVTMFELLSGGFLPFDGDPAEVVGLKATLDAPKLAEIAPDAKVPPALATLVDRLLSRRRSQRHADARAVAEALDEAVRHPDDVDDVTIGRSGADWALAGEEPPPTRRRAARADDAEIGRGFTTPAPVVAGAPPAAAEPGEQGSLRSSTVVVRAPGSSRQRVAILAGAVVLAGIIVGAVVWFTRSADPASAEPAAGRPPAPSVAAAAAAAPRTEPGAPPAAAPGAPASAPAPAAPERPATADERAPKRPERARPGRRVAKAPSKAPAAPATGAPDPEPAAPVPMPPVPTPTAPPPEPAPPAPPEVPAPPAAPLALEPRLASLDVHGALPNATVRRALDRVLPAARACHSDRAGAVEVRFTLGESRRAAGLRANGLAASGCLTAALSALRTETAPDVGDVEVAVRFTYEP